MEDLLDLMSLHNNFSKANVFKRGDYTLKSGVKSDIYADFRILVSYPKILKGVCEVLAKKIVNKDNCVVAGVPMGGIPFAFGISLLYDIPSVIIRDKPKDHGTKNLIEGKIDTGKTVVIVEDVITTGKSVCEVLEMLELESVKISQVLCILDRKEGGVELLKARGYNVVSLFTVDDILK